MKHKTLITLAILATLLIGSALALDQLINHPEPQITVRYEVEEAFPNLTRRWQNIQNKEPTR